MIRQLGHFFLFIGVILLVIFFATNAANAPAYEFFCWGTPLVILGIYLLWRKRPEQQPRSRFRLLRGRRRNREE
jgi:hypothetical protein